MLLPLCIWAQRDPTCTAPSTICRSCAVQLHAHQCGTSISQALPRCLLLTSTWCPLTKNNSMLHGHISFCHGVSVPKKCISAIRRVKHLSTGAALTAGSAVSDETSLALQGCWLILEPYRFPVLQHALFTSAVLEPCCTPSHWCACNFDWTFQKSGCCSCSSQSLEVSGSVAASLPCN